MIINLDTHPWFYLVTYQYQNHTGMTYGHQPTATGVRITTPDDLDDLVRGITTHVDGNPDAAPRLGAIVLTGVTLISGPDDRDDTDEWRRTMAIYHEACAVAAAWAAIPRTERTFLGDQLRLTDFANTLDALVQVVKDADA